MKKIILLILLSHPIWKESSWIHAQGPTNLFFETGNFSGWKSSWGPAMNPALYPLFDTAKGKDSSQHYILPNSQSTFSPCGETGISGTDVYEGCGVCGNFIARLGSYYNGINDSASSRLSFFLNVTSSNKFFYLLHAVVFEDGGHAIQDQSYFEGLVKDTLSGDTIWYVKAIPGTPGYSIMSAFCPTTYTRTWYPTYLDLSSYIGSTLLFQFSVSDCFWGSHDAYAFIDASYDSVATSLPEEFSGGFFIISPNPTSGQFTLDVGRLTTDAIQITIYNVYGEHVYSVSVIRHPSSVIIDLSSQSDGIYFIHSTSNEGTAVKKIILSK